MGITGNAAQKLELSGTWLKKRNYQECGSRIGIIIGIWLKNWNCQGIGNYRNSAHPADLQPRSAHPGFMGSLELITIPKTRRQCWIPAAFQSVPVFQERVEMGARAGEGGAGKLRHQDAGILWDGSEDKGIGMGWDGP